MQVLLSGLSDMLAAMAAQAEDVVAATEEALNAAAAHLADQTSDLLSLTSHSPGTPTPSVPGEPPSLISGNLRGSVLMTPVSVGGLPGVEVGPTAIYGRIQELGGATGRNYTSYLPPRPYLMPALAYSIGDIADIFWNSWAEAISD